MASTSENLFSFDDLNALKQAIGQGVKEVWYGDKRVVYRNLDEMLRLKSLMERELGLQQGSERHYGTYRSGLKNNHNGSNYWFD